MYDPGVAWIKDVSWWNGVKGAAERRIWLRTDGQRWRVEARQGPSRNSGQPVWHVDLETEAEARTYASDMRDRTGDAWQEMPRAWLE